MFRGSAPPAVRTPVHPTGGMTPPGDSGVTFEYVGRTALTVVGRTTGQQYRFDRTGSRVQVDPRDRQSVAAVPVLRAVGPTSGRR